MNKLYYFILFCFAALCFTACSDDDLEFSGIEGKDHYISDFALNVGGIIKPRLPGIRLLLRFHTTPI